MDFKKITLLATIVSSCSDGTNSTNDIGSPLSEQTSLYNAYGIESSAVFMIDESTNRILGVDLNDLKIRHSFELVASDVPHSIAMDLNQKFLIDFSKKNLDVITMDGIRYSKPFSFQGTPVSAAYNPFSRVMVMQDDLKSIGMIKFSENGSIEKSWLGGPQIADSKTITAGDIDGSSRLALSMSDDSILNVDLEQSMTQQSWQYTSFSPGISGIDWVAPDVRNDLILTTAKSAIAIIDLDTNTVVDQEAISTSDTVIFGRSKAGRPHVFTRKTSQNNLTLYYINESNRLASKTIANTGLYGYRQSYMNNDATELTMLTGGSTQRRILRVRLSDALVLMEKDIDSMGTTNLGADKLFINRKTGLGSIELHDLTTSAVKRLDGFNFDYLRSKN